MADVDAQHDATILVTRDRLAGNDIAESVDVDPALVHTVVQGAVAASVFGGQRQFDQRGDRPICIRTWVNDEPRQDGTSAQMVFGVAKLIASASEFMTLNTGDIILTGTPAGPGIGRKPQVFLDHGDVVSMEISNLGRMSSVIQDEK